jgi:hypothetical protein
MIAARSRLRAIDALRRIAEAFVDLVDCLEAEPAAPVVEAPPAPPANRPDPSPIPEAPGPFSEPPIPRAAALVQPASQLSPAQLLAERPARAPVPAPPRGALSGPSWLTRERADFLKRWWPTYAASNLIYEALLKMAGPALPTGTVVGITAVQRLLLRRPEDIRSNADAQASDSRALRDAVAAPAPRPSLAPPAPAAAPVVAGVAAATAPAVKASYETIVNWAAQRGIIGKLDLDRVNAKRRVLQLPPFELLSSRKEM